MSVSERAPGAHRICVFCGSNPGRDPRYVAAAREVGERLARRGAGVVYGGGRVGLMGALADAALAAGGEVIGVIPRALVAREVAHQGLSELILVDTMHERKAEMSALSRGFLVLPGGVGTLEEAFEVITWRQLAIYDKPCAILNVGGFYDPLLEQLERATAEGFVARSERERIAVGERIEPLVDGLLADD